MTERGGVEWPADLDLGSPLPAAVQARLHYAAGAVREQHVQVLELVMVTVQHLRDVAYTSEWDAAHILGLLWDRYLGVLTHPDVQGFPDVVAGAVLEVAGLETWPADLAERDRWFAAVRTVGAELTRIEHEVMR